MKNLTNKTIIR